MREDQALLIQVFDVKALLEERVCQIVELPSGEKAAMWRGVAYRLAGANSIDISQPGLSHDELVLVPDVPKVAGLKAGRWAVVQGGDAVWVLVAGDVILRDEYAAKLRHGGFDVLRVGQWLGESVQGFDADWFIRVERPLGDSALESRLASVLGGTCAASTNAEDPVQMELSRQRALEDELAAARAQALAFEQLLGEERQKALASEAELFVLIESLEAELAEKKRDFAGPGEQQNTLLTGPKNSDGGLSPTRVGKPVTKIQDEISSVLTSLLPNMKLLRSSLRIASSEYRDRGAFYRALGELATGVAKLPPAWKKLRGADGWWERHVSTGEDDSGRLYARYGTEGASWQLLLSFKSEQSRDVAWLEALG
jgi:hypothetical protein